MLFKTLSQPYKLAFFSIVILNSSNYSASIKADSIEIAIAGALGGACVAAATTLWNFTTNPPHFELSNMENKKKIFDTKQENIMRSQEALTKVAMMLQELGPHLPIKERELLERKLLEASQHLQNAGQKFAEKYRPEYLKYIQNL